MAATLDLCYQLKDYILSEPVQTALNAVYSGPWTATVRYSINDEASDLDTLEISVLPGQINQGKPIRMAMEVEYEMGVQLRKRLDSTDEIPNLASFAEELFLLLDSWSPTSPARTRGVSRLPLETASVYAYESESSALTYDSIISVPVKYWYRKAMAAGGDS
ncbi:MAG: hypothetical protein Q4D98_03525 [Planctomycetia bacterium]|nr:hypothetical protein [Planctomycetia bacterium]